MNKQDSTECPQPSVLVQFLQGKLQPPQLDQCESHLKDCSLCHETLVGLSSNDTLSERVAAALQVDETGEFSHVSSDDIQSLLDRLTSDDFKESVMSVHSSSSQKHPTADAEIIADRAAEVLRCVTPSEDSLGILGDYTLIRLIGAGSTGVVFQAMDQTLDRTVALKVLRPSLGEIARNRFLIEAKLAASIEHVNVVTIFQVGQVQRLAFMAMPWLPGQTLDSLLASGERLKEDQIVDIMTHVAAGLDAAHQKQLVHRDIKPANLWICEDDHRLKILDFGLARISDDNPNLTATGMLAGTPNFMSPEQTRGLELDGRSDLFSLGCVLYRLLAGRLPFGAPTVLATLTSIQTHHPRPPVELQDGVNKNLSDLTMSLLEKQPANRPQSASQTIELLTNPRDQWPIAVPSYKSDTAVEGQANTRRPVATSGAGSRRGWSTWVPAMIGLAMLGGFGWWFAPQIILIATDKGEVKIEATDDNVEIQVLQDGKEVCVIDTQTQRSFSLKSGQYSFNAKATGSETKNSFTIAPQKLTMFRGDTAIVKVEMNQSGSAKGLKTASSMTSSAINKPFYQGKTFQQWFHTAKFDRSSGAMPVALEGCARTADTQEEWTQLLDLTMPLILKPEDAGVGNAIGKVIDACDAVHIFEFVKSEIVKGKTASLPLFKLWFDRRFDPSQESTRPFPFPWKQVNELTDLISYNFEDRSTLKFLEPMMSYIDGPEAGTYLTRFRKSEAGIYIKQHVFARDLQKRFDVYRIALETFEDEGIFEIYKRDLLNSDLNNSSVVIDSVSKPWPAVRPDLLAELLAAVEPDFWAFNGYVDPSAKAKYVSEASDLLAKVTDRFLEKRLLFSNWENSGASQITNAQFLELVFYDFQSLAYRTSDVNIKQLMLQKLEAIKGSLTPEALTELSQRYDLDALISLYKSDPPSASPLKTPLLKQDKQKTTASQVQRSDEANGLAEDHPTNQANKPFYQGKTFAQWMRTARLDRDPATQSAALQACVSLADSDQEKQQLLKLMRSLARVHGSIANGGDGDMNTMYNAAFTKVLDLFDVEQVVEYIKSEIAEGTLESRKFCTAWLYQAFRNNGYQRFTEKVNEVRERIPELLPTIDKHFKNDGMLLLLKSLLIEGEDDERQLEMVRNSQVAAKIKASVFNEKLQTRYDVSDLAILLFYDDEKVLDVYKKDLLDPSLNGNIEDSYYGFSKPWTTARRDLFDRLMGKLLPQLQFNTEKQTEDANTIRRTAVAADILAKITDGVLSEGKKRLIFSRSMYGYLGGERLEAGGVMPNSDVGYQALLGATEMMTQSFYNVAARTNDDAIKHRLLKKLEAIKASLNDKMTIEEMKQSSRALNDLDYLIAYFKGSPPANLPNGSLIWDGSPRMGGGIF